MTRPRNGRYLSALLAFVLTIGLSVLALANPASAAGPAAGKAAPPTRDGCTAVDRPGQARCFSLIRTDLKPKAAAPNLTPDGYGPTDLQSAYQLPSADAGAGQTVALVDAFDAPTAEADLATYRSQYGLPACTTANGCFTKVNQDGTASPLPPTDAGWATEISLDLDMVSAACPNCKILLVEADDNYTDNLAASVDTAVALGAKYVSNSYGSSEDPTEVDYDAFYNHPGVAVTASTGDYGYGTSYPAAAPGVTAVGGTSLTSDSSARGWSESAWDGAGSGCSDVEPKPSFQTDPGCPGRSIADVSAVADPATGVAVYDSTPYEGGVGWQVYGGTSAASPLIASVYALAGTPAAGSNPESYPYAKRANLNDVTTGSNGSCAGSYLCTAQPGYDGPTGLGTPAGVAAFSSGPHGTLTGTVTDSGTPIAGAKVTAGTASAITATNGTYTLSVPTGTYTVTASAYGYKPLSHTNVVVADGASLTENFALTAVPSVAVSGNVTDGSGHAWPLYAKITVADVPGGPVYTDPFTGHYELNLPSGNSYSMKVEPVYPGYAPTTVNITLGSDDVVHDVSVPVDVTACDAPGYQPKYTGAVEHFDADTIPSTWTVKDNDGGGGVWVANDPGDRGNLTGGSGNFAIVDSDYLGTDTTEDTDLISPVVDLSSDGSPEVGLNSDYKSFFNSVADIDYTIDGGATWTNVWEATTTDQQGPLEIPLPGAAHQSAVQVRFHYTGEFAYYWEVDDVFIGTKTCVPVHGGLVAGYTKDGNTKKALLGVTVASNDVPADAGVSAATPEDPAHPDGLYWLFSSVTGNHKFTASKARYTSSTATVAVAANYVTRKDFTLGAGQLTTTPSALSGTVTLGASTSSSFTLKNTGTAPVHVKLGEQDGGFQIAGRPATEAYQHMTGAPVHRVTGTYSPLRMKPVKNPVKSPATTKPADAPWQAIADYPTPISNNSASFNDGKVYSVGGFDGTDDVATAYAYDPTATAWTQLPDMSTTREAPTSAWINGKLYVTGGWGPDASPTGVTEAYDPAANAWSTVAANPKPHAGASAAVLDGRLYVIGGCDTDTCGSTDVEVYDPASDAWSTGTDYPDSMAWESCGTIADQIYCAGGTNDDAASAKTYSFDGTSWTALADLPDSDWGAAYAAANGQLVVSGGVVSSGAATNEGWSYDPSADAWTALPNSNNAFYRLGGACGFYKIGGSVSNLDPAHAESEVLPGYDDCGAGADVSWLAEDPTETDVAPGASVTVDVTMDSSALTQPGTYLAAITVSTDTPYQVTPVQVTFTVNPPKTWGKISGVVSGRPCTGSAAPIAGATVEIDTWAASYTLITDKDGKYALWLDKRNNPLTLIAAKDGWAPQTTTAKVTPSAPLTVNFTLKPAKACQ